MYDNNHHSYTKRNQITYKIRVPNALPLKNNLGGFKLHCGIIELPAKRIREFYKLLETAVYHKWNHINKQEESHFILKKFLITQSTYIESRGFMSEVQRF